MKEETGPQPVDLVRHITIEERNHATDLTQTRHLQHSHVYQDYSRWKFSITNKARRNQWNTDKNSAVVNYLTTISRWCQLSSYQLLMSVTGLSRLLLRHVYATVFIKTFVSADLLSSIHWQLKTFLIQQSSPNMLLSEHLIFFVCLPH